MSIKKSLLLLLVPFFLLADDTQGLENLTLDQALEIMKANNLELKISKFNEQMKEYEAKVAQGYSFGKLDATFQAARSNDAGNVFGFKLKSREANFGDFGFDQFLGAFGQAMVDANGNPDFNSFAQNMGNPQTQAQLLAIQPTNLNYPETRNHYQTTISYMIPIFTGGKLSQYRKITKALHEMSQLDTEKLFNEKVFQTKKTFCDIALVDHYILNLNNILSNIDKLEEIVSNMQKEGFAKELDTLEVQARKSEAQSMLSQANFNRELAYQYLSFLLNTEINSIETHERIAPMPNIVQEDVNENNLDIQQAELGLEITDMNIRLQQANFLPEVGAMAEYGSSDDKAFNEFREKDFYTIGVQAKWNIFNGNIDKNNLEKAKVENLKVREQVSLAKKGIYLKVRKSITEIKSKDADIASLEKQLEFASRVYETYQEQYKEGISSISDVLMKQSKELEVLLKLLTVKNDRNNKIFELNSIINEGELL